MDEGAGAYGRYGPRQPLPVPVEPLRGESTGSFVNRLAHRQGLQLDELLERVGFGQASRDPERVRGYPRSIEMYVNPLGLRYLATLCGASAEALQAALPSLARRHLLPEGEEAVWEWPWIPREGRLVPLCGKCGRSCGVTETAWMICLGCWRMCARHRQWTDDSRYSKPATVPLEAVPETVVAQEQREWLLRRFGAVGGQLFADAFQVAVSWWTHLPDTARWVQRAWSVGLEAREVRTAPVVVLPEAAELAVRMLDFERAGERGRWARERWLAGVRQRMDAWGVDFEVGRLPLLEWLQHHGEPSVPARPGDARVAEGLGGVRLPGGHEQRAQTVRALGDVSCLPWQLGQPACHM